MQKENTIKADLIRLFRGGFTPGNIPPFGLTPDTVRRYYREWTAAGNKAPTWKRLMAQRLIKG